MPPQYAPPTPRGIRMVEHTAKGESRIQIFARGQTRGQAYYNPITHQVTQQRHYPRPEDAPQPVRSRYPMAQHYPPPRSLAEQYTEHLARRRGY